MASHVAADILVSCEHASCRLPRGMERLFAQHQRALGGAPDQVLKSHRGWDPGAKELAVAVAQRVGTRPLLGRVSRLVVDLNRSLHHPRLFSKATQALSVSHRLGLIRRYHHPHWQRVVDRVNKARRSGRAVIHLACHSFVPVMTGKERQVDVGLLYDPRRPTERSLADDFAEALKKALPHWRLRRNQPYRGRADGLPTALRAKLSDAMYQGFEIEVNQAKVFDVRYSKEKHLLAAALCHVLTQRSL